MCKLATVRVALITSNLLGAIVDLPTYSSDSHSNISPQLIRPEHTHELAYNI